MHLRGGRLNNLKFKRQVPIGSYIVDFCCDELKLAVELDGGHHDETRVRAKDTEKREFLRKEGYRILRFWNNEIDQNIQGVLKKILQIATSLPASPHAWGEGAEWKCSHRGEGNKI
jgi:adenine-specific DNA-methyltransferase